MQQELFPLDRPSWPSDTSIIASLRALLPPQRLTCTRQQAFGQQQADRLLEMAGLVEPPVPTGLIEAIPRVRIEVERDLPVHGAVAWLADHWVISVAGDDPEPKQRHTICHELKHALDHPFHGALYRRRNGRINEDLAEAMADHFGMCLLAPKPWVIRAWKDGVQNLDELAELFGVTKGAMRQWVWRLGLSGYGPTCGRRLPTTYPDVPDLRGSLR